MRADWTVIEAKDVCLSYKTCVCCTRWVAASRPPLLNNVGISAKSGQRVSIVGLPGSGRSSLLYCLSDLVYPTAGDVVMKGDCIPSMSNTQLAGLKPSVG